MSFIWRLRIGYKKLDCSSKKVVTSSIRRHLVPVSRASIILAHCEVEPLASWVLNLLVSRPNGKLFINGRISTFSILLPRMKENFFSSFEKTAILLSGKHFREWMIDSCKMVLTFATVGKILWRYHTIETSPAVLSHGTIHLVRSSNFGVCGQNPLVWPFKWNLFRSTFAGYYLICR